MLPINLCHCTCVQDELGEVGHGNHIRDGMCGGSTGICRTNPNQQITLKFEMENATIGCHGGTSQVDYNGTTKAESSHGIGHGMGTVRNA